MTALPVVAHTSWEAIFDIGRLQLDQTILIHGAGGGVGSMADNRKLDEYLDGIRAIERRIEQAEKRPGRGTGHGGSSRGHTSDNRDDFSTGKLGFFSRS